MNSLHRRPKPANAPSTKSPPKPTTQSHTKPGPSAHRSPRYGATWPRIAALACAATAVSTSAHAGIAVRIQDGAVLSADTPVTTEDYDWRDSRLAIRHGHTLSMGQSTFNVITIEQPIDALINQGTLTVTDPNSPSTPLAVLGHVNQLVNTGIIRNEGMFGVTVTYPTGASPGPGGVDVLTNGSTGVIHGASVGLYSLQNTLGVVSNDGRIDGGLIGIFLNSVTAGTLRNEASGAITASRYGLVALGGTKLNQLVNAGTLSSAGSALEFQDTSTIGQLANTGTIAGNISNQSHHDLVIAGGDTVAGLLTGYGGKIGTIDAPNANVVFASGRQRLNDNITVMPGGTVKNTAATLEIGQTITVRGNYDQRADAVLAIGVSDTASARGRVTDTGYGRLVVTGKASLEPGSGIALTRTSAGYAFASGQRYVVIDAAEADYHADTLNYDVAGFTGEVVATALARDGRKDLVITLGDDLPTHLPAHATVPNAINALDGLGRYTGVEPELLDLYDASRAIDTTHKANRTGNQLSPVQPLALASAAQVPTFDVLNVVSDRINTLRRAQAPDRPLPDTFASAPPTCGAWMQGLAGHTMQSPRDGTEGYRAHHDGIVLGADCRLHTRWAAGMAVADSHARVNGRQDQTGTRSQIGQNGLFAYASKTADPWYVNISFGAARQRYQTRRAIDMDGFHGRASGAFGGQQYVAKGQWGLRRHVGALDLTPHLSLRYSYLHQNAYAETGGNGAALSVGGAHGQSLATQVGLTLSKLFSFGRHDLAPSVDLGWRHELIHARWATQSQFLAAPDGMTTFTTAGPMPVSDLAELSLGLTVLHAGSLSVNASYDLQAGDGFVTQGGHVRLLKTF